jgi:hypothetical protein
MSKELQNTAIVDITSRLIEGRFFHTGLLFILPKEHLVIFKVSLSW